MNAHTYTHTRTAPLLACTEDPADHSARGDLGCGQYSQLPSILENAPQHVRLTHFNQKLKKKKDLKLRTNNQKKKLVSMFQSLTMAPEKEP